MKVENTWFNPPPNTILENVIVYEPTYIHPSVEIGRDTTIGAFCDIGKQVKIGKHCNIQCHVTISNGCIIGDYVFIGPNTSLLNDKYMNDKITPVIVQDGAKIGGHVVILPNVIVGKGSLIGAGAVVTKDVPPGVTVKGCPAR